MNFRDRTQDNSRAGFEKREKRRQIRKLQDAITAKDVSTVKEILEDDFDVDFQYRGQTALQQAVKEGQEEICKLLIDKGADIGACDAELNSLLHIACKSGYEDITELLINNTADINALNDSNTTPISVCAFRGDKSIADLLIRENCDLNLKNLKGETPLVVATQQRHAEMVEFLIQSNCQIDLGDENNSNSMIYAAKLGFTEILQILIKHGAELNHKDRQGCTPLYHAVKEHQIDIIKEIIKYHSTAVSDKRIQLDTPSTKGMTPLLVAITNNCPDIANMLLDAGCDVNKRDRLQNSPIHVAVRQVSLVFGQEEEAMSVVKKIVQLGCDINVGEIEGKTPLILSAFAGNKELTELFLQKNADVTKCTTTGDTALHAACSSIKSNPEIVEMLVKAGCRVNDPNNNGEIPLFSALFNRADMRIIRGLVKNGSDLNYREKTNLLSPLHEAIIQNLTEAAIFLIDSGCDINKPNKQLQQPLYTACEKGNEKIVQYLLSSGKCQINGLVPTAIPLHVSMLNNHGRIVEILAKAGCNLNRINHKCLSPIMFAAEQNELAMAKILLKYGCDLNAQAKVKGMMKCCLMYPVDKHPHFELEPLFFAVTHKNRDMIDLFLHCYNDNPPYWVMQLLIKFLREISQLNAQMTPDQKKELIILFLKACKLPRSLQQICRGTIRETLGTLPQDKVIKLPLAEKLKDYILMKEIFIEEETKEEELSNEERDLGRFN
ncbi:ankyrin repeat and SOCS box protein 16-like isoform X1 [Mytilus galloprovincialis]|uniref:ankyrin repeat and SOCS box protein 16-like isoform X1 n=1 Tax=Mytilus galloprovincialis TaxID=29158 RepID=UPI003F7C8D0C